MGGGTPLKPKRNGLLVGEGRESLRGIIYSIKVTFCLALLDSLVPRRPLGLPHPAKELLGLPWHQTCRQRRLTDRKKIKNEKQKFLEVTHSQAPNALFNRGWEESRARRGESTVDWVPPQ